MIRLVTIAGFVLCGVLALALVVMSRRNADRIAPLSELLDQVMVSRATRLTIMVFWWWLGWHFIVAAPMPVAG
jgi:hypothetical protein